MPDETSAVRVQYPVRVRWLWFFENKFAMAKPRQRIARRAQAEAGKVLYAHGERCRPLLVGSVSKGPAVLPFKMRARVASVELSIAC